MPEAHCPMLHGQMVTAIASCTIGIWNDRQRPQPHARGSLPDVPRPDGHGHCLMCHWHLERPPEAIASCQRLIASCTIGIWNDRQRPLPHARGSLLHVPLASGKTATAIASCQRLIAQCTTPRWSWLMADVPLASGTTPHGHSIMPEAHCPMLHAQMVTAIASCTIGIWNDTPRPLPHARGSLPDVPRANGKRVFRQIIC